MREVDKKGLLIQQDGQNDKVREIGENVRYPEETGRQRRLHERLPRLFGQGGKELDIAMPTIWIAH